MALSLGAKVGSYQILAVIGAGGMGEVYRARDTRLNRDVAIKSLPHAFSGDADRLARFTREAHTLASLNHPNIAQIYGLEEFNGTRALVMELVEGETLADRLQKGTPPLEETISIFRQIALALEYAHENGIIHRDLKPANVKIRPDGTVKLLDFGLAKAFEGEPAGKSPDLSSSPTQSHMMTEAGIILGTASYMSPEQAKGKAVDKRTDIWSFGVVLFECLTDKKLFEGESLPEILGSIFRQEITLDALPATVPDSIRHLLSRCIERDPSLRLRDIGEARIILSATAHPEKSPAVSAPAKRKSIWKAVALTAIVMTLMAAAATMIFYNRFTRDQPSLHFEITGASFNYTSVAAISHDGSQIAYVPYHPTASSPIYIRALNSFASRPIHGTEGAANPFFSPDGSRIGYFANRNLYVVHVNGGAPQKIALVPEGLIKSGYWASDNSIFFSGAEIEGKIARGISIIRPDTGDLKQITKPTDGERDHWHPYPLPGGRWLLFTAGTAAIDAFSLESQERHRVIDAAINPQYTSGHLLFYRESDLNIYAAPFDIDKAVVTGEVKLVQENVSTRVGAYGTYAVAENGTMIFTPSEGAAATGAYGVVWVDRKGTITSLVEHRDSWTQPRISPDGRTLLINQSGNLECMLWTYDLNRGTLSKLTFNRDHHGAAWHPSGKKIVFSLGAEGARNISEKDLDPAAAEESIVTMEQDLNRPTWSADGKYLVFDSLSGDRGTDLYVADLSKGGKPQPWLASPFNETLAAFSPDGRWLAYVSDESGRNEVYIRSFPEPGTRIQISTQGGTGPLWSRDGKELFYSFGRQMMDVNISYSPEFSASVPRKLFDGPFVWERAANYDITPDGQRLVMIYRDAPEGTTEVVRVITNLGSKLVSQSAR
ncbi:protein kinase [bacterium]|nr:protein kinase [bacterium]